ncbi:MAG TPA: hypothetical protein VHG35_16570 [Gemmatimonadales bacterium]|nr:hypothetical protein [Gemmatimonadales bacterium]
MRVANVLRSGSVIALMGLFACGDQQSTSPESDLQQADAHADAKKLSGGEVTAVSPMLGKMNARLARAGSNLRVARADVLYGAKAYEAASPTVLIANNRTHTLAYEWVAGDPRRDGRTGVTYAIDPVLRTTAFGLQNLPAIEVDGGGFRASTQTELEAYIEEAMQAWRDRSCADAPIQRVSVPAGTDPDQLDEFFLLGQGPGANYAQPADIVQAGWLPPEFFDAIVEGGADGILGVAFSFWFVDDQGTADPSDDVDTDINGDGKLDTGLVEIYYNPSFVWTNRGHPAGIDFYSVITHESGHALGLAHFGKVFVTKRDAADGIQIADVKYAPKALMNAVYVTGRDEIAGSDNASFCQIWASK